MRPFRRLRTRQRTHPYNSIDMNLRMEIHDATHIHTQCVLSRSHKCYYNTGEHVYSFCCCPPPSTQHPPAPANTHHHPPPPAIQRSLRVQSTALSGYSPFAHAATILSGFGRGCCASLRRHKRLASATQTYRAAAGHEWVAQLLWDTRLGDVALYRTGERSCHTSRI